MRTGFAVIMVTSFLFPGFSMALPVPEVGQNFPQSMARLFEHLSAKPSGQISYYFACQTLNHQYGVEIQQASGQIYCQYLNQTGQLELSPDFIPLFPDEDSLDSRAEEFLVPDNKTSEGYWDYREDYLRYIHSQNSGKTHVLLPRDVMASGSGLNHQNTEATTPAPYERKIDIGATIAGAGIAALAFVVIVSAVVEAKTHWGKALMLAVHSRLSQAWGSLNMDDYDWWISLQDRLRLGR